MVNGANWNIFNGSNGIPYMIVLLTIFFASYCVLTLCLLAGWVRSCRQAPLPPITENHFISVVVAVRNEQHALASLLCDLRCQRYTNFEVVVVDDHSRDATRSLVTNAMDQDSRVRLLFNTGSGKKRALSTGIDAAKGVLIATTDGDCRVTADWLFEVNRSFQNAQVKMVIGPVKIEGNGLFAAMQAVEFSSLIASGVATLSFGLPTMCNGANLAFRRTAYYDVNGYDDNLHIASGDDEFLMRKIFRRYHTGVKFMGLSGTMIATKPLPDWQAFFQQRIRWAGKWRYNPTLQKGLLALYIFLFQFVIMLLPGLVWVDVLPWSWAVGLWMAKAVTEFFFLRRVARSMKINWRWDAFMALQLLYPFYAVGVGFICNFASFTWKERRLELGKEKTG